MPSLNLTQKLHLVQNVAAKMLTTSPLWTHIQSVLRQLQLSASIILDQFQDVGAYF